MSRKYTTPLQDNLREALRQNPDGLTASALAAELDVSPQAISNTIAKMPDVWIDRWYPNQAGNIWCAVYVTKPEDAPKPQIKVRDYLRKIGQATSIAA